jgi:hypothetical protein
MRAAARVDVLQQTTAETLGLERITAGIERRLHSALSTRRNRRSSGESREIGRTE